MIHAEALSALKPHLLKLRGRLKLPHQAHSAELSVQLATFLDQVQHLPGVHNAAQLVILGCR